MSKTQIEWTDYTWNPYLWRCTKVSPGCQHCYMMALAVRRGQDPGGSFGTRWPAAMRELRTFPPGVVIFVNSMSDTYHVEASVMDIHRIHNAALTHRDKTFLVLTKRPERAYHICDMLAWPENLWLGVSVESADYLWRIDYALATPAAGVFVSAEPLLEDISTQMLAYLDDRGWPYRYPHGLPHDVREASQRAVDWVIVGGESGPDRRWFDKLWARNMLHNCAQWSIPFFFKQGSAFRPGQDDCLDGRIYKQVPAEFLARGGVVRQPVPAVEQPCQLRLF